MLAAIRKLKPEYQTSAWGGKQHTPDQQDKTEEV
jgi:hypothetical protein